MRYGKVPLRFQLRARRIGECFVSMTADRINRSSPGYGLHQIMAAKEELPPKNNESESPNTNKHAELLSSAFHGQFLIFNAVKSD